MRIACVLGLAFVVGSWAALAPAASAQDAAPGAPPPAAPAPAPVIRPERPEGVAAPAPRPDEPRMLELFVGDGMAVRDLLLATSAYARVPIVWSPHDKAIEGRKLVGSPRIRVPEGQLLDAVQDLLVPYEVVFVPLGTPERVVWFAADARMLVGQMILRLRPTPVEIADEQEARALEGRVSLFVTAVLRVPANVDARAVRAALSRAVTPNNVGSVQEIPDASAIVVTDFAPVVVQAWRTLRLLAPPAPEAHEARTIRFLRLAHREAGDVAQVLGALFDPRTSAPRPGGAPGPVPDPVAAGARGADAPVRIAADVGSRTIVVHGTERQVAEVERVVQELDRPSSPK